MATKRASLRQADSVLKEVEREYGPGAHVDGAWGWDGPAGPAIIWEGGPPDWAPQFSGSHPIRPNGVWTEPATSWALNVYREVT